MKKIINTEKAPSAIGPYSQAVVSVSNGLVFVSGQLGLDPKTGEFVSKDVGEQTRKVLENLHAVLTAAGSSLGSVLKTTVFLANMDDFAAMNKVYAEFFTSNPPARAAVQAACLPKNALVEIEAIAEVDKE